MMSAAWVCAQEVDEVKAIKVKAAYLYNFAKFIEWPDDTFKEDQGSFVIGVLGYDPFGRVLDDTVEGKEIAKRAVKIRRLRWSNRKNRSGLTDCHILYISQSERYRLNDILETLREHSVLVVSDIHESARDGGMIEFVLEKGRIIFEINREAMEKAGLKASSRLLKLARIVEARRHPARESQASTRRP